MKDVRIEGQLGMHDIMIDIETLGVRSTSVIVQVGACYFNRETGEIGDELSLNIKPDTERFTTDQGTIDWWSEQSPEAKALVFTEDAWPIDEALYRLERFLSKKGRKVWSHATFDIPILLNAFEVVGARFPIHYKKMRDIRTLTDLAQHFDETPREGVHHNALDDCKYQVKYCVEAMRKLKHGSN